MIEVVCGVIRDNAGRFLACRRPLEKHLGGLWEFPGGKIEPDENAEEALARELREELGIEVAVGFPLTPVRWQYERGMIQLLPFICRIVKGEPKALEHSELFWCASKNFSLLDWAPADQPVLKELLILSEFHEAWFYPR